MKIFIGRAVYILMGLAGIAFICAGISEPNIIIASPELIGGVFLYGIGRDVWKNLNLD